MGDINRRTLSYRIEFDTTELKTSFANIETLFKGLNDTIKNSLGQIKDIAAKGVTEPIKQIGESLKSVDKIAADSSEKTAASIEKVGKKAKETAESTKELTATTKETAAAAEQSGKSLSAAGDIVNKLGIVTKGTSKENKILAISMSGISDAANSAKAPLLSLSTTLSQTKSIVSSVQSAFKQAANDMQAFAGTTSLAAKNTQQALSVLARSKQLSNQQPTAFSQIPTQSSSAGAPFSGSGTSPLSQMGMSTLQRSQQLGAVQAAQAQIFQGSSQLAAQNSQAGMATLQRSIALNQAMNSGLQQTTQTAQQTTRAINSTSQAVQGMGTNMHMVNGLFDPITRTVRSLKNDLMDLGRMWMMAFGLAAAAIVPPLKAFADIEKELLMFKSLTGSTTQEMNEFGKSMFALSEKTATMTKDLIAAGTEIGKLGVAGRDIKTVLEAAADTALTQGISVKRAAEISVGVMGEFHKPISEISNVMNVLSETARASAGDFETLAQTLKYAGPVAHSSSQSLEEIGAASIILSKNMILASQQGTTLRTIMTNLQKPTAEAARVLEILGINVQNTKGQMRPILDIIQDIGGAMKGFDDATKNAAIAMLFGKYALSGSMALINAHSKAVEDAREKAKGLNASQKEMADEMRKGLSYAFEQTRVQAVNAAAAFGEQLAPAAKDVLNSFKGLFDFIAKTPPDVLALWAQSLISALQTLMQIVTGGALILGFRSLMGAIASMQPHVIALATAIGTQLVGAIRALGIAFVLLQAGQWGAVFSTAAASLGPLAVAIGVAASAFLVLKNAASGAKEAIDEAAKAQHESEAFGQAMKSRNEYVKRAKSEEARIASGKLPESPLSQSDYGELVAGFQSQGKSDQVALYGAFANAKNKMDQANARITELSNKMSGSGVDRSSPIFKQWNKEIEENMKVVKENTDYLKANNQLSADEITEKTAEQKAREQSIIDLKDASKNSKEDAAARKANAEATKRQKDAMEAQLKSISASFQGNRESLRGGAFAEGANQAADAYERLASVAKDWYESGGAAKFAKRDAEGLFAQGIACNYTTNEILRLGNVSDKVLSKTTNRVDYTINALKKAGLITEIGAKEARAGDLTTKSDLSHIGMYMGGGKIIDSSSSQRNIQFRNQWMQNARYWRLAPEAIAGVGGGKFQVNLDAENSANKSKMYQAQIAALQQEMVKPGKTADFKQWAKEQIDSIKVSMEKAGQDAADSIFKKQISTINQLGELFKNLYKERLKLEGETEQVIAEMNHKGFENSLKQIKILAEEKKAEALKDLQEIPGGDAKANEEINRRRNIVNAEIDAQTKAQEDLAITREIQATKQEQIQAKQALVAAKMGQHEAAQIPIREHMLDLQNKIVVFEELSSKASGEKKEIYKQQLEALNHILGYDVIRLENEKILSQYDAKEREISKERLADDQKMFDLQQELSVTKIGQAKIDKESLSQLEKQLNGNRELYQIIGGMPNSLDKQSKLNELTSKELDLRRQIIQIQQNNPIADYEKAYQGFERGHIGKTELKSAELEYYNKLLADPSYIQGADTYNKILSDRNDLLLEQAIAQKDLNKVFEAFILKTANVEVLENANIQIGDLAVNGRQLVESIGPAADAFGRLFAMFDGGQEFLSRIGEAFSHIASLAMNVASQNWIGAIVSGFQVLLDMLTSIKELFTGLDPIKEKELANALADISDRGSIASIEIRRLKGEISELDATSQKAAINLGAMQRNLDLKKMQLAALQAQPPSMWKGVGAAGGVVGFLIGSAVDAAAEEKKRQETAKLQAEILADQKEIDLARTQSTKENNDAILAMDEDLFERRQAIDQKRIEESGNVIKAIDSQYWIDVTNAMKRQDEELKNFKGTGEQKVALAKIHTEELDKIHIDFQNKRNAEIEKEIEAQRQKWVDIANLAVAGMNEGFDKTRIQTRAKQSEEETKAAKEYAEASGKWFAGQGNYLDVQQSQIKYQLIMLNNQKEMNKLDQEYLENMTRQAEKLEMQADIAEAKRSGNKTDELLLGKQAEINAAKEAHAERIKNLNENRAEERRVVLASQRQLNSDLLDIDKKYIDQAADVAKDKFSILKQLRQDQFDVDKAQYELVIKEQEDRLVFLKKQRDDLQAQLDYYNNLIDKKLKQFNKDDKSIWEQLLQGVNLPDEIRKGLEWIANPEAVPNERFSVGKTWQKAIQERVDMLNMENESRHKLEEISDKQFYEQQANIALIQAKLSKELLNNPVYQEMTSQLTYREKMEIYQKEADAYVAFQEAKQNAIKSTYESEQSALKDSIDANEDQQKSANQIIQENQYQMDILKLKYENDIAAIDKQVKLIEAAHRGWKISIDDVRNSFSSLVTQVTTEYNQLLQTLSKPLPSIGSQTGTASGGSGAPSDISIFAKKDTGTGAPAGYPVQYGDYWFKDSTTAAQYGPKLTGMASGGIIPDLGQFANDGFGPVRLDRNEAVIPLDELWKQMGQMNKGNSYYITVTGNKFENEIDFEEVFRHVKARFDSQDQIANGRYYLTLG